MDYMEIELTQGKVAKVDAEDYGWLSEWKWYYNKTGSGYARRRESRTEKPRRTIYMHRAILEHHNIDIVGIFTDHANLDTLDNQKANLRPATIHQSNRNQALRANNTSGFIGVGRDKRGGQWRARIWYRSQVILLGTFDDPAEAARAYDRAALKYHGKFATLNFPEEHG